jgi:predicted GIY-YIG superfamily endonuclease
MNDHVYILLSEKEDLFYTGYSGNLEKRINDHILAWFIQ